MQTPNSKSTLPTVLLIDPQPELARQLNRADVTLRTAATAATAAPILAETAELALVLAPLAEARALAPLPDETPLLVWFDAPPAEADLEAACALPAADVLAPPFVPALLQARLKTYLQLHRLRQATKPAPAGLNTALILGKVLDSLDEAVIVVNPHTRLIEGCNRRTETMFGYSRHELVGQPTRILYDTDEDFAEFGRLADAGYARGEEVLELTYRMRRKNGQIIPTEHFINPIYEAAGAVNHVVSVVRDMSERVELNAALTESQRRLQAIFDHSQAAIFLTDNEGRFVDVNPAACQLLGYTRPEFLQKTVWDIFLQANSTEGPLIWQQMLQAGTVSGEIALLCKDGSPIDLEFRAVANILPGLHLSIDLDISERKQAELQLHQSHAFYRGLVDAPDHLLVARWHNDGITTFVNRAYAQFYNTTPEQLIGTKFPDLIEPEETRLKLRAYVEQQQQLPQTHVIEHLETGADGQEYWMQWIDQPIFNPDGTLLEFQGIGLNITARKQAEQALRESEERLQQIMDNIDIGLWMMDRTERRLLTVNPALLRLTHIPEQALFTLSGDALPQALLDTVDPTFREMLSTEWGRVLASGQPSRPLEYRRLDQNGNYRWVRDRTLLITNASGQIVRLVGLVEDITAARNAHERINYLAMLVENVSEAIISYDAQYNILSWNRAAEQIYGYTASEAIGQSAPQLFKSSHIEGDTFRDIARQMAENGHWRGEVQHRHKDGHIIEVLSTLTLMKDNHGRPTGAVAVNRNISARRQVERQLEASFKELQQLSGQLVEVQETERRALARELHDEIGQNLTGLKLLLDIAAGLPAEQQTEHMAEAQALITRLITQVRELSLNLRPALLDDLGLLPALLWHIDRYEQHTGIAVEFLHSGIKRRFAPELETAVYRITQEALTNVARYAAVGQAQVKIRATASWLEMVITDAGTGFDPSTPPQTRHRRAVWHERAGQITGRHF